MGNIYNIPGCYSFADALAKGMLKRADGDPQILSRYRILLPTRRACRTVKEAFLRHCEDRLTLLPRLEAIGDPDEDEITILGAEGDENIPPALSPITRLGLLFAEIMRADHFKGSYKQALALAKSLMRLMDEIYIEGKSLDGLKDLVPENFAQHWQITLDFLDVLKTRWPEILKKQNAVDPLARRSLLLSALCKAWRNHPPKETIIAAGITGSVPDTTALMETILTLDKGEVILAGLDPHMSDSVWDALDQGHPHHTHKKLLQDLNCSRYKVHAWPWLEASEEKATQRETLWSQVMLPAVQTKLWMDSGRQEKSVQGLRLIECDTQYEEAGVIALKMREALEDPENRVALVTPDRNLAMRVKERLQKWQIEIDDSAGQPLDQTPRGSFLLQVLGMFIQSARPTAILSLFKHSMMGDKIVPQMRSHARQLDKALRGPIPKAGLQGIERRLGHQHQDLLKDLQPIFNVLKSFEDLCSEKQPLKKWLQAHIHIAEQISANEDKPLRLWAGDDGEAAAELLSRLMDEAHHFGQMDIEGYTTLLVQLFDEALVRPKYGIHPRVTILGLLESRLARADVMILAGLNEGTWPPDSKLDPWMSRPMRREFGLPTPEQKIGFAAHDFVQGACANDVLLTRSKKVDGTPMQPSRWLQRMEAFFAAQGLSLDTAEHYKDWLKQLDLHVGIVEPVVRPAPKPPKDTRPRIMSVTNIESWMQDPYSIYAKYILKLRRLDQLEKEDDPAQRGSLIHDALYQFIQRYSETLPEKPADVLISIFKNICADQDIEEPETLPWWPRFIEIAQWVSVFEAERREQGFSPKLLETKGSAYFEEINFTIEAKLDRMDVCPEGEIEIIDYKTGNISGDLSKARKGEKPQLPLTALIALKNGYEGINKDPKIAAMTYLQIVGSEKIGCSALDIKPKKGEEIGDIIDTAYDVLKELVMAFDQEETTYISLPDESKSPPEEFQDYAHLARVKEWQNESEEVA